MFYFLIFDINLWGRIRFFSLLFLTFSFDQKLFNLFSKLPFSVLQKQDFHSANTLKLTEKPGIEWKGLLHSDFQISWLLYSMAFASSKINILDFCTFQIHHPTPPWLWMTICRGSQIHTPDFIPRSDRHILKLTKTDIVIISLFKNGRYR